MGRFLGGSVVKDRSTRSSNLVVGQFLSGGQTGALGAHLDLAIQLLPPVGQMRKIREVEHGVLVVLFDEGGRVDEE